MLLGPFTKRTSAGCSTYLMDTPQVGGDLPTCPAAGLHAIAPVTADCSRRLSARAATLHASTASNMGREHAACASGAHIRVRLQGGGRRGGGGSGSGKKLARAASAFGDCDK